MTHVSPRPSAHYLLADSALAHIDTMQPLNIEKYYSNLSSSLRIQSSVLTLERS